MLGASGNYLLGEMVSTDFEFRMRSELAAVPILANAVEAWCERQLLALKENLQLNLVIEELVTNVIVHGWHGNSEGHIRLRLSCSTLGIELELSDDGPPFNPLRYPAPNVNTSLAELPVGGLGIHLVRSLTTHGSYRRQNEKNVLCLCKPFSVLSD
ncbi:ATP-binding protein [Pseudoduganella danionis]